MRIYGVFAFWVETMVSYMRMCGVFACWQCFPGFFVGKMSICHFRRPNSCHFSCFLGCVFVASEGQKVAISLVLRSGLFGLLIGCLAPLVTGCLAVWLFGSLLVWLVAWVAWRLVDVAVLFNMLHHIVPNRMSK